MDMDSELLRAARHHFDLSQLEAAELLKVSIVTYQRWEQGKAKPQPYHRRQIRSVFGKAFPPLALLPEEEVFADLSSEDENVASHEQGTSPQILDTAPVSNSASIALFPPIPAFSEETERALPNEPEVFIATHMVTHLWSLAFMEHATSEEKRSAIRQAIKEFDSMNTSNKNYQITRREALCSLATLPMITLGLTVPGKMVQPTHYGKALEQCTASLEACWELYQKGDGSDTSLAFKSVSTYLSALQTIIKEAPYYRNEALDLATRYALLKTRIGWVCAGPTTTITYAKNALALSKETNDISLQLSAFSKLAWAYFYDRKYVFALTTAQEAEAVLQRYVQLPKSQPLHPIVQGGTYSTLALMLARNGQLPDDALGKVSEIDPGDEQEYAMMNSKRSTLLLEAGWTYCYYGNQRKAMETLAKRVDPETLAPKVVQSAHGRIETINIMALSSLKVPDRDMEKTLHFWIAGIEGAKALQHEQRFQEALIAYDLIDTVWPNEKRVIDLQEYIRHW